MGLDYADEKLNKALYTLMFSSGDLHRRMTVAWQESLMLLDPELHLAEDLRGQWEILSALVTDDSLMDNVGDEGTIAAKVSMMESDELREVGDKILELRDEVQRRVEAE